MRNAFRPCLIPSFVVAGLLVGCVELPEPKVTQSSVLEAAKTVIAELYPMHAVSEQDGIVLALSPVGIDGSSRTRKQISVLTRRNYTGSFDADVSVRKWVAKERSHMSGNPELPSPVDARPLATTEWQFLDSLPYEEQAIYEAIHKKLQAPKGM